MARGKGRGKDRHGPGRMVESDGDGPTWLTTYADAITLLMAFFVILYAMSQVDAVKFELLVAGLAEPFGNDAVGYSAEETVFDGGSGVVGKLDISVQQESSSVSAMNQQSEVSSDDPFYELLTADPVEVQFAATGAQVGAPATSADEPGEDLPFLDVSDLEEVRDQLLIALQEQELLDQVDFEIVGNTLKVSISADEVLFASGSSKIQPNGEGALAAIAPVIARFGNEILIAGHTDDRPLNRGGYTNWNLSTDRAVAVVQYFARTFAIAPERLGAEGFAEFRPRVPNDSNDNRAKNRRVEMLIVATG